MYKRLLGWVGMLFLGTALQAQVSISLQEPPSGVVQKNQLWNVTLIYSGNTPLNVTIGLSLFDIRDNQPVLTAFTRPVALTKGVRQLRASDVAPVDYNYFSPAFNNSRLPDAFLPVGNYRVCYTVYTGEQHGENVQAEECINLEVQPLSPPQLNMPADSAVLETPYPQFNWLPPTPVILFGDLNYDILVTEVLQGQTSGTAIQENIPVYNMQRLSTLVNNYPASYKSLDTCKTYAWKVIAKNGDLFAAQSETWTFTIGTKKPVALVPANAAYLELKAGNSNTGTGSIPGNVLGIKYYSYDKTHDAVVRFLNQQGRVVKEITKNIQYGNNFIVFKLDHSFSPDAVYDIEITDLQGSRYRASFRITEPTN
jgi:hypothetical protein